MAATNPPPIRVPKKLAEDREIFAYFNELHTFLRLLWTRTGGGEDLIGSADDAIVVLTAGLATANVDIAALEVDQHVAVTVLDTADVVLTLADQLLSATLTTTVNASLALADSAVQEADLDGQQYARQSGAWAVVAEDPQVATNAGNITSIGVAQGIQDAAIALNTAKVSGTALLPLANTWTGLNTFTAGLKSPGAGADSFRAGTNAGATTQGAGAIAIGQNAGQTGQPAYSVAIGFSAGQTSQGSFSLAVGRFAGQDTQGANSVAFGTTAGRYAQGANCSAFGYLAGNDNQGANSIAFGGSAGQSYQGTQATALGAGAGTTSQGNNATALGRKAGETSQGTNSLALGLLAGQTSQGANGIILNATGVASNDTTVGHIHIVSASASLDYTAAAGEWTATVGATTEVLFTKEALQAVVAASADFAAFKTNVAAL
jgi:hypothetical protein